MTKNQQARLKAIQELVLELDKTTDKTERKNIKTTLNEIIENKPLKLPTKSWA